MQPITFVTLSADEDSTRELRDVIAANSRTHLISHCDNREQMYIDVTRLKPAAAIITLGANPEQELALIKRLVAAIPSTALIVAAANASPSLVLNSMRAGAREFLQLPINPDDFKTVLERTAEFYAEQRLTRKQQGKVAAVFSSKGGSGASFVAANLAAASNVPTMLVDLNLQAGDLDSFLNIKPKYSIANLINNRQRVDETLLTTYATRHSDRLALLAAPLEAHEADDIRPEHILEVVHILREHYAWTVLDVQHTFDPVTVSALDQADDILLVMTLDIPSIRNTKRALEVFDRIGYPRAKTHVVVNRWSKQIDVELQKIELHLGERLIGFIPNDYRKVMDSINLGQPIVLSEPASKISSEIKRIATLFSGVRETPVVNQRKGILSSIFNRQSASASSTSSLEFRTTSE